MNLSDTLYSKTLPGNSYEENIRAYDKRRLNNLFYSIINYSSATIFDIKSIGLIFKYYNEILDEKYKTSSEFKNSLNSSQICFKDPSKLIDAINKLKEDKADSFIIMPSISSIHTLSIVIRKQNDGLKFYTIDKFTTHFNSLVPKSPYAKEFIIKKGGEKNLLKELSDNAFKGSTLEVFDIIEKHSIKSYKLNLKAGEQKVFTCLFKEPEAGIKFAFATRNLNTEQFQLLRSNNSFSRDLKIKWGQNGNDTEDVHKRFLEKIKEYNPRHNFDDLDSVFKNYSQNKKFRRLIKEKVPLNKALEVSFGTNQGLSRLNFDSIHRIPNLRFNILSNNGIKALHYFECAKFDTTLFGTYANVFSNNDFKNIEKSINEQEKKFSIFAKQAREYFSLVNTVVAYALFEMYIGKSKDKSVEKIKEDSFKFIIDKVNNAVRIAPYSDKSYFAKGVFHLNNAVMMEMNNIPNYTKEYQRALESLEKTTILNPTFLEARYMKAVTNKKLGNTKESLKEFEMANKSGLIIINDKDFFNKKLYFNCLTKEVCNELLKIQELHKNLNNKEVNKKSFDKMEMRL